MTKKTSNNPTERAIMTTEEVADYLRIPVSTVYKWRHEETGPPAYRLGKHLRFRRADVYAWFDRQAS